MATSLLTCEGRGHHEKIGQGSAENRKKKREEDLSFFFFFTKGKEKKVRISAIKPFSSGDVMQTNVTNHAEHDATFVGDQQPRGLNRGRLFSNNFLLPLPLSTNSLRFLFLLVSGKGLWGSLRLASPFRVPIPGPLD